MRNKKALEREAPGLFATSRSSVDLVLVGRGHHHSPMKNYAELAKLLQQLLRHRTPPRTDCTGRRRRDHKGMSNIASAIGLLLTSVVGALSSLRNTELHVARLRIQLAFLSEG